jgi:hypothetical protein
MKTREASLRGCGPASSGFALVVCSLKTQPRHDDAENKDGLPYVGASQREVM